jgi:hypothetical protein
LANGDRYLVVPIDADTPTLKKLALYREEGKTDGGEVIKIAP